MKIRAWARHAAAPVLVMALVMAACGGGAAGGGPEDNATADPDPLATIAPLDPATGGGDSGADDTTSPEPGDPGTDTTEAPGDETPIEEEQVGTPAIESSDPHVVVAMTDLASRMGVAPGDITLMLREEVMWRDGSLGCPQPGFSYTQALVDGYKIMLEVNGVSYAYHGRAGQDPFLCENDLATEKGGTFVPLEPKAEGGSEDLKYDGSIDD